MNGAPFLQLATELATRDDEAGLRTSVSRSYYAAYHIALKLALRCGIVFPKSGEVHGHLVDCLKESGNQVARHAGLILRGLRDARNFADYDLNHSTSSQKGNAEMQLSRALSVIENVTLCCENTAFNTICTNMRKFAKREPKLGITP